MTDQPALDIIVFDENGDSTATVAGALQETGLTVHVRRLDDPQSLQSAMAATDLVLAGVRSGVADAVAAARTETDISVLVIGDRADPSSIASLLAAGARDVVHLTEPGHLRHAVLREWRDLQERRAHRTCRMRLASAERRAAALLETSRDAIALFRDGVHLHANAAYLDLFGFVRPVDGEPVAYTNILSEPADAERFALWLGEAAAGSGPAGLDFTGRRVDGSIFTATAEATDATFDGRPCVQVTIHPLLPPAEEPAADRDLLTGLFRRDRFVARLAEASADHGYVLCVRPDNLRAVEREVGVTGVDVALAELAVRLIRRFGDRNVARLGEGLFGIYLPDADARDAGETATALIRESGTGAPELAGHRLVLTLSIGAEAVDPNRRDPEAVIRHAEAALREALRLGGDTFQLYDAATARRLEQERDAFWEKAIRRALDGDGFRLLFQPIMSLRGDATENYEGLLRLVADNGEYIAPSAFLPAARRAGLMGDIDRWVVARAARLLGNRGNINVFVKLADESLADADFGAWLDDLVATTALPAMALTLEIEDAAARRSPGQFRALQEAAHRNGMRIALDHFSPSAEEHPEHHVNFLKLEAPLVADIADNKEHQALVRRMVQRAHASGAATIAPFVENANTLAALWTCGIDYIQGYFLQEPEAELNFDFNIDG